MKTTSIIQKNIEEIRKLITRGLVQRDVDNDILVGVGVYYRDEAERILQSLLDEQKKEIVERIKEEIDLLGEPNDILHEDLNNILNKLNNE